MAVITKRKKYFDPLFKQKYQCHTVEVYPILILVTICLFGFSSHLKLLFTGGVGHNSIVSTLQEIYIFKQKIFFCVTSQQNDPDFSGFKHLPLSGSPRVLQQETLGSFHSGNTFIV